MATTRSCWGGALRSPKQEVRAEATATATVGDAMAVEKAPATTPSTAALALAKAATVVAATRRRSGDNGAAGKHRKVVHIPMPGQSLFDEVVWGGEKAIAATSQSVLRLWSEMASRKAVPRPSRTTSSGESGEARCRPTSRWLQPRNAPRTRPSISLTPRPRARQRQPTSSRPALGSTPGGSRRWPRPRRPPSAARQGIEETLAKVVEQVQWLTKDLHDGQKAERKPFCKRACPWPSEEGTNWAGDCFGPLIALLFEGDFRYNCDHDDQR